MGKIVHISGPPDEIRKLVAVLKLWRLIFVALVLNFAVWAIIAASLGGEAVTGKEEAGRYFLHSKRGYTEVSAQTYRYSNIHTLVTWAGGPLCLLAIFVAKQAASRLKKYEVK